MTLAVTIATNQEKMPAKKQAQLQIEVSTDEEWENLISSTTLITVVDVYSGWCGPCKAVQGLLRRLKNELGKSGLLFAAAKSDKITALEKYRERSQPCFQFLATGGSLVAVVHGADGPLLESTMKAQLEMEEKVLKGEAERVVIEDKALLEQEELIEEEEDGKGEEQGDTPTRKQYTVAVIKPDAVASGMVEEILAHVESAGLEVLCKEERTLTREEAEEFYKQHEGSDHFEELVEFMTSGPCMTLVISKGEAGEGALENFRELLGPTNVDEAKESAPESLRAKYGTGTWKNGIHGSDSSETAARELAFFFPKYCIPWVPGTEPPIQRTLAIIRPAAYNQHKDEILSKIKEAGFEVAMTKEMHLSREQAEEFYSEHKDKDFFESLMTHMSSGPVLILALAREDAVEGWRQLLGPPSLEEAKETVPNSFRAQYSVDDSELNQLHCSDSAESAAREINYFFPPEQTVAVIKPSAFSERERILKKIEEAGFSVSLSKESHLTKEQAEHLYSEHKDKEFFGDLTNFMSSGPSLLLVLSRYEAIQGWRGMMGAVDPAEAKEADPNCLRALFGTDKMQNAVHGSSNKEKAEAVIKDFFEGVEFNPDGTIKTEDTGEDKPTSDGSESEKREEGESS